MGEVVDFLDAKVRIKPHVEDDYSESIGALFADDVIEMLLDVVNENRGPREASEEELDDIEILWECIANILDELLEG